MIDIVISCIHSNIENKSMKPIYRHFYLCKGSFDHVDGLTVQKKTFQNRQGI